MEEILQFLFAEEKAIIVKNHSLYFSIILYKM